MYNNVISINSIIRVKQYTKRRTVKILIQQHNRLIFKFILNNIMYNLDSPINIYSLLYIYNYARYRLNIIDFTIKDKKDKTITIVY